MNENHVTDQIAAYALGALNEEERRDVARHLAGCSLCQADLQSYQAVTDQLPLAVAVRNPPPHLRMAILDQAVPPLHRAAARPAPHAQRRPRILQIHPAWALASLAVIAALVLSNLLLWRQVQRLQASAPQQVALVEMSGTGTAPEANGVLLYHKQWERGVMIVENLPQLPEDRQYQLWLIRDGQRTSGGVFSVRESGYGFVQVSSPEPLPAYQSFGVTIEPAGGSPGPTGDRVLGGSF